MKAAGTVPSKSAAADSAAELVSAEMEEKEEEMPRETDEAVAIQPEDVD